MNIKSTLSIPESPKTSSSSSKEGHKRNLSLSIGTKSLAREKDLAAMKPKMTNMFQVHTDHKKIATTIKDKFIEATLKNLVDSMQASFATNFEEFLGNCKEELYTYFCSPISGIREHGSEETLNEIVRAAKINDKVAIALFNHALHVTHLINDKTHIFNHKYVKNLKGLVSSVIMGDE